MVAAIVASVAAVTLAGTWFDIGLGAGVGNRVAAPTHVAELQPYHLGVGNRGIDFSLSRLKCRSSAADSGSANAFRRPQAGCP